ncbi:MAG: alpha/beta hydrolase [Phaeodactylibacter sp.]|nr:alpha/beta hydrolase [Phaeodactylibacter sp.]MCB9289291.1 alpha/beta hydrolase [Lewinellaceae bacterium]
MEAVKKIEYLKSDWAGSPEPPPSYPSVLRLIRFLFGTLGYLFPRAAGRLAYRLFSTPRHRARHRTSDSILESARLFEVLYGQQILKGYEWGKGDRTVLLVHGWESRGTALRSFVPALVENGFRVVAFDGPAHGNSGGRRTNLLHFGGAVRAVLHHIGGAYGIITHSFGGASTVFALSNLDPTLEVEKLVLIGAPSRMDKVLQDAIHTLNLPAPAARQFFRFLEKKVKFPVRHADVGTASGRHRVRQALIIHDKKDDIVPFSEAQSTFEAWENANLLVTEGCGHYRLMKNPDLIKRVADFICES